MDQVSSWDQVTPWDQVRKMTLIINRDDGDTDSATMGRSTTNANWQAQEELAETSSKEMSIVVIRRMSLS